jgi:hypothetical protein
MTDPYALDDVWLNAFAALMQPKVIKNEKSKTIKVFPSDPEPLVKLLRGDTPMPPSARDTLAELLSPGKPEYLMCKLVAKSTDRSYALSADDTGGKNVRAVQIAAEHGSERDAGLSSADASEEVGKKHLVSGRRIDSIRADLKTLHKRFSKPSVDEEK